MPQMFHWCRTEKGLGLMSWAGLSLRAPYYLLVVEGCDVSSMLDQTSDFIDVPSSLFKAIRGGSVFNPFKRTDLKTLFESCLRKKNTVRTVTDEEVHLQRISVLILMCSQAVSVKVIILI